MTKVANLVYGSVCRGIGAGEVAWEPQGSRCAFLSEIDKFPCAVLAHRLGAGTHGPRRSLNMERTSPEEDMRDVVTQAIVLLQMAERAGFHSAWSAEHHTIELTIAPNPFSLAHLLGATYQPDQTRHRVPA